MGDDFNFFKKLKTFVGDEPMKSDEILYETDKYVITPESLIEFGNFLSAQNIVSIPFEEKFESISETIIKYCIEVSEEDNSVFVVGNCYGYPELEEKLKFDDEDFEELRNFVENLNSQVIADTYYRNDNIDYFFQGYKNDLKQKIQKQALKKNIFLSDLTLSGIGYFIDTKTNSCINICDTLTIIDSDKNFQVQNLVEKIPQGKLRTNLQIEFFPTDKTLPSLCFNKIKNSSYDTFAAEEIFTISKDNPVELGRRIHFGINIIYN